MRAMLASLIAVALMAPVTTAAAKHEAVSWGKAGVSFDQYRNDAVQCGRKGYYRDVSHTDAAQVFKTATRRLENNDAQMQSAAIAGDDYGTMNAVAQSANIVESTRPDQRMKEVRTLLNETVANCLAARGYSRFRLTEAQQRRLGHLRRGTPQRHEFLYSLASDPAILTAQAI
jgi:hypothetical protein